MTAVEMLDSLRRRGIILVPSAGGELRYRPRNALSDMERTDIARHREEILAQFDADPVGWRATVMRSQLPPAGAIPLLLARPGIPYLSGSCCSCGDPLAPDVRHRCSPCVDAAVAALEAAP